MNTDGPVGSTATGNELVSGIFAAAASRIEATDLPEPLAEALDDLLTVTRRVLADALEANSEFASFVPDRFSQLLSVGERLDALHPEEGNESLLYAAGRLRGELEGVARTCLNELGARYVVEAEHPEPSHFFQGVIARLEEYDMKLRSARLMVSLEAINSEASSTLQDIRQTAGETGTFSLWSYFGTYAKEEQDRAMTFLVVGIGATAAAVLLAWELLNRQHTSSVWSLELARAFLVIPILAISYYCFRESSAHLAAARSARGIEVRLKVVRAYTDELPEVEKMSVRAEFGRSIFTATSSNAHPTEGGSVVTDLAAATRSLSDIGKILGR